MMEFIPGLFSKEEEFDLELFSFFAEHNNKLFRKWKPSEDGSFFDILIQNITGGTGLVELKFRKSNYSDFFIEPEKLANISASYAQVGYTPIYINFCGGKDEVWLWYLPEVPNMKFYPCVSVNGNNVARFGLDKKYGHQYLWDPETSTYQHNPPTGFVKKMKKAKYESDTIFDKPINNNNYLIKRKTNERIVKQ